MMPKISANQSVKSGMIAAVAEHDLTMFQLFFDMVRSAARTRGIAYFRLAAEGLGWGLGPS